MGDIINFAGDHYSDPNEWVQPPEPAPGIDTTEGFETHQADVGEWLKAVSDCQVDTASVANLEVFAERYGISTLPDVPDDSEAFTARVMSILNEDPRLASLELQKTHIDLVILSPVLSLFQKADLLAMSTQALYDGKHPVNGNAIVQRSLKFWQKRILPSTQDPQTNRQAREFEALENHMNSLGVVADETLPNMTRRDFYRHAASVESGKKVTNILEALGILLAVSEQPSFKQISERKERQIRRDDRMVRYAEDKKRRSLDRLNKSIDEAEEARERLSKRLSD